MKKPLAVGGMDLGGIDVAVSAGFGVHGDGEEKSGHEDHGIFRAGAVRQMPDDARPGLKTSMIYRPFG